VTRGQLPQRAGSLGLNGGGAAAAVPPAMDISTEEHTELNQLIYSHATYIGRSVIN